MPNKFLQSIGFRLTMWNAVVVLIAATLAMIAVRETMRVTIGNDAKGLLQEEALELAIRQLHPDQKAIEDEFERKVMGHHVHGWFAALMDQDDVVRWSSSNFPNSEFSDAAKSALMQGNAFIERAQRLIVVHRFIMPDKTGHSILIGEPTQFIENDVWQLTRIMLAIGTVMLVVAPVTGYWLARRAISPVRQIISTTRSLDPQHLESRLPLRGTGDELDQISQEINSFVDQIARHIASQRDFVANAAHELRSPITAIQTSIDVALENDRSIRQYQEELATVSEQCQLLRHLVNQLLELAENDTLLQRNSFGPTNFTALIEKSINVFSGVAEEKGVLVETRLQNAVFVNGDGGKLRQMINNLLDNALKFSPAGGRVENDGKRVKFSVCDSGPGVAPQYLAKIFDRFFQVNVDRCRDGRRGNGLGLSICKSIVQLHRGEISAAVDPGGFTVVVLLPN